MGQHLDGLVAGDEVVPHQDQAGVLEKAAGGLAPQVAKKPNEKTSFQRDKPCEIDGHQSLRKAAPGILSKARFRFG